MADAAARDADARAAWESPATIAAIRDYAARTLRKRS
jgi:hypothetical protein